MTSTHRPLLPSHLTCLAAACAAALAAAGCAAPPGTEPEPVAEAAAPLSAQTAFGLVQLISYDNATDTKTLMGYGYIEPKGDGVSFQRFLLLPNHRGDDFTYQAFDPNLKPDPSFNQSVTADLQSWEALVKSLWGPDMTYAMCTSLFNLYAYEGSYGGVGWDVLPSTPPPAAFAAWNAAAGWHVYTPVPSTPRFTPLDWPPSEEWLNLNPPGSGQIDPGDGKIWQGTTPYPDNYRGFFFSKGGFLDDSNIEYVYMAPGYAAAGSDAWYTHMLEPWLGMTTPEQFWDEVAIRWGEGSAVSVTGCTNYHDGSVAPSPL